LGHHNNLPKVGTFAQRNKNRPNKIGLKTVLFLDRNEKVVLVKGLMQLMVLLLFDIKPVLKEFEPKGEIRQPLWTTEIMSNYWGKNEE